jgi:hypothetical protein
MNTADELIGQLVLIHPDLTTDPARKAGQVGIITGAELENEMVYVGFGRNGHSIYGTDAVLLLQPNEQIRQNLREQFTALSVNDYKSLFQISLLQELKPSTANIKTAMSLALQSEAVRNNSMRSLEDALGLRQQQYLER